MQKNHKVVFFDLGGVVVDVQIEKFFSAVQKITKLEMAEISRRMKALEESFAQFQRGRIHPEAMFQRFCQNFPFREDYSTFVKLYTNIFQLKDEVAAIIHSIAPRVKVSVISNTDILHYQYLEENFPVMSLFHKPVTSYTVGALKPESTIYHYALQSLDISPESSFFVDDKPENVATAIDLGMRGMVFQDAKSLQVALTDFLEA